MVQQTYRLKINFSQGDDLKVFQPRMLDIDGREGLSPGKSGNFCRVTLSPEAHVQQTC